jgi:hypothetical protein
LVLVLVLVLFRDEIATMLLIDPRSDLGEMDLLSPIVSLDFPLLDRPVRALDEVPVRSDLVHLHTLLLGSPLIVPGSLVVGSSIDTLFLGTGQSSPPQLPPQDLLHLV